MINRVDLQTAGRRDLQAASALVALFDMQVNLAGMLFVVYQGAARAGSHDLLAGRFIRAQFAELETIVMASVMDGAARFTCHAAQGQVIDRAAITIAGVALGVSEIDQKSGVFDHPGYLPGFDALELPVMRGMIFLLQSGSRENRATQHFRGVTAFGRRLGIPAQIADEWLSAPILDGLYNFANKYRMNDRITDMITYVRLDGHFFFLTRSRICRRSRIRSNLAGNVS